MNLVFEDKQKRIIKEQEEIRFSTFSSYHLIIITGRAKDKKQTGVSRESLTVEVDDRVFSSPAKFVGGDLHDFL